MPSPPWIVRICACNVKAEQKTTAASATPRLLENKLHSRMYVPYRREDGTKALSDRDSILMPVDWEVSFGVFTGEQRHVWNDCEAGDSSGQTRGNGRNTKGKRSQHARVFKL